MIHAIFSSSLIRKCKIVLLCSGLIALLKMPDAILHLVAVLLHTVYESIAYAVEHALIHLFELSKFQAQMTVFYGSCVIGIAVSLFLARQIPQWFIRAKQRALLHWLQLEDLLIIGWHKLSRRQVFQLLAIPSVCLTFLLMLS